MLSFGTAELAGRHDRRSILIQPYIFNLTDSSTNQPRNISWRSSCCSVWWEVALEAISYFRLSVPKRSEVYRQTCALLEWCNKPDPCACSPTRFAPFLWSAHAQQYLPTTFRYCSPEVESNLYAGTYLTVTNKICIKIIPEATLESKIDQLNAAIFWTNFGHGFFQAIIYHKATKKKNRFRHVSLSFYSCRGQFTLATNVFQFGAKNHRLTPLLSGEMFRTRKIKSI